MDINQAKTEILKLAKESPLGYRSKLKHSRKDLLELVMASTVWMPSNTDLTTRIWYFLHDKTSWVTCAKDGCNAEVHKQMSVKDFDRIKFFCCNAHAQQDESTIAKVKATKKAHFGDENFNNKDKASQTLLEKYGVSNAFNIPSNVQARRTRNLQQHGNANWNNSDKAKATVLKKTEEDADYWKKRSQKTKETKVAKGHDPNWNNSEKQQQTCLQKYGTKYSCCTQNAKAKREDAFLKKYGNKSFFKTSYFNEVTRKENGKRQKRKFYHDRILCNENVFPLFSEEDYVNVQEYGHLWRWKCKKCGTEFEAPFTTTRFLFDYSFARCPTCYPFVSGKSEMEKELAQLMKDVLGSENITCGERAMIKPFELDVLAKSRSIAVEFDGLYYHGVKQGKPADYHLVKTELCESKGIQLVHVFEDEWLEKRSIVESRLKNLLGIYDETVFARKCEVREITSEEANEFQEQNHIQGHCNAKVRLGLYFADKLISLMTFGKTRYTKNAEWELLRFCNKLGYHVPGGASKLLRHFERNYSPKSLISYADRRWSRGKLYEALGFTLDHISKPNYWYVKNQHRFSRVLFQKHKLKAILKSFNPAKTETQNMFDNGYDMIFDCGNLVFIKNYS